mmetsp:Transcript_46495/g.73483  ORF Transcript_46495/g.73483 Transcript_46495/m.73483 type:complete len:393 (-) Transcript_46495:284-1462(-)
MPSRKDASAKDEETKMLIDEDDEEEEESVDGVQEKDHIESPDTELDQDTFGMALCALTRDTHFLSEEWHSQKEGHRVSLPRIGRLLTTLLLLFFTIGLQMLLLWNTKKYVTAKGVHDIRIAYSRFEEHIYACNDEGVNSTACEKTKYGHYRGMADALPDLATQKLRLSKMDEQDQGNACRIPLSQPYFFYLILLIWTLTCFRELRKSLSLTKQILQLETVKSMMDTFVDKSNDRHVDGDHISGDVVIKGVTWYIKLFMLLLLTTRVIITVILLWLGCRWLLATNRFSDLILNAIALEFILELKELVHGTLVPARNSVELAMTKIRNPLRKMRPGCMEFMGTLSILFLAMLWCYLYMCFIQDVLPDYRWDVREVCQDWIKKRFNVDAVSSSTN